MARFKDIYELSRIRAKGRKWWLGFSPALIIAGVSAVVVGDILFGLVALAIAVLIPPFCLLRPSNDEIPSVRKSVESSKVAWGLWHTGDYVRAECQHIGMDKFKKMLLLEPTKRNKALTQVAEKAPNPINVEIEQIRATAQKALTDGVDVRWYWEEVHNTFTIWDDTPVAVVVEGENESQPRSDRAWMVVQVFTPTSSPRDRDRNRINNKAEQRDKFDGYFQQFNDIWNDPKRSRSITESEKRRLCYGKRKQEASKSRSIAKTTQ